MNAREPKLEWQMERASKALRFLSSFHMQDAKNDVDQDETARH